MGDKERECGARPLLSSRVRPVVADGLSWTRRPGLDRLRWGETQRTGSRCCAVALHERGKDVHVVRAW